MTFKGGKQQAINNAHAAAYSRLQNMKYGLDLQGPIIDQLCSAMEQAIHAAIESLVNDMYTDAEFEKDMGLSDVQNS